MKYASTFIHGTIERVEVILPLSAVPGFNPLNPPQPNTYGVPDEVQVGWVKVGDGFVAPPPVSPSVPVSVSKAQFRLALLAEGLLDDVEAFVMAANDPALTINWRDRSDFERHHPLVVATATALGKTEAELDALFVAARSL